MQYKTNVFVLLELVKQSLPKPRLRSGRRY